MQRVTISSTRYHTHYLITFCLSVAWFGAICNTLSRLTIKFIKRILICFKKIKVKRDYALQIAQNQGYLRENIQ